MDFDVELEHHQEEDGVGSVIDLGLGFGGKRWENEG